MTNPEVSVAPTRDERLRMFLEILAAAGGASDCGDWPGSWINAFCEDHEKQSPDTFNRAADLGYTRATYDSDTDHGVVTLTNEGRAHLARLAHQTPPATQPIATVGEVERLTHVIDRERYVAAACVNAVEHVLHSRRWLREAGRGSYAYDDERYQQEFGLAFDEIMEALRPMRAVAMDKSDCTTDPEKVVAARVAGAERFATLHTPPPVATATVVDAGWQPRIGERVEVADHVDDTAYWRSGPLWVAAVRVHDSGDGLDVTVAEQWPIPWRHSRDFRGQTDGFRVGAASVHDDLRPLAATPTPPAGGQ